MGRWTDASAEGQPQCTGIKMLASYKDLGKARRNEATEITVPMARLHPRLIIRVIRSHPRASCTGQALARTSCTPSSG